MRKLSFLERFLDPRVSTFVLLMIATAGLFTVVEPLAF